MYIPKPFKASPVETLLAILPNASFAQLITSDETGLPQATHLPMSYDATQGEFGTLYGHIARANPHGRLFTENRKSLVVFNGPHDYVSPSYYKSDANVPTWNYVAVHAYGTVMIYQDPESVLSVLKRLSDENEAGRERPWRVEEFDGKRLEAMAKAIVAFEIPVENLQAKVKLGQNKTAEDKIALAQALKHSELATWQADIIDD
ncbi:FMN-binding negative transcriptional regulator [Sneathiella glossodoripedis]|uniref:FMN-binding negative transcriptional regulator n=1 Tax=Sneathiella glossodoripedis TaxID=418853 RepID=UPI00047291A8|nr:FMN-binding negative transcriptional regulator [Sneathiella glossodoripedis]